MDFVIGGLAASAAGFFSNPLDVLKTRMQLQGELRAKGQHAVHYRNVFHAAKVVIENEGVFAIQKGLVPAVTVHGIRNSVRLGSYQWINDRGLITDKRGDTIFWKSFFAAAITGAAGAFLGSPLFLIKTQLQSQSAETVAVGYQHGHSGTIAAIRTIFHRHGIRGLWRGSNAVVVRALAGSSSQLSFFAVTKDFLNRNNKYISSPILISFTASMIAGIFQTITITPFDLVSTRMYNQAVDSNGKGLLYSNIPDCFMKIWRTEGILAFYKGVTANYMRLGPHGALTLVFWDMLKNLQKKSNLFAV